MMLLMLDLPEPLFPIKSTFCFLTFLIVREAGTAPTSGSAMSAGLKTTRKRNKQEAGGKR